MSQRFKVVAHPDGRKSIVSNTMMNSMMGGPTVVNGLIGGTYGWTGLLEGVLTEDESIHQKIYSDIYEYDATCGTTVDLRATLVSSSFSLTGLPDHQLEVFQSSINRLGFPNIVPQMFLDYYVRGSFISTLLYNQNKKQFLDQMVHSAGDCEILDNPLYGGKPVIKYTPPDNVVKFFTDTSQQATNVRNRLNPDMVHYLSNRQEVELDDLLTVYVPRPSISGKRRGVSMFKRVVPLYILEKLLYRGTFSEAQRRQRAITHITAGSDTWQPIDSELQMLVSMFQRADMDPVGAILATRNDINVNEFRNGGDFWKYTDLTNDTTPLKLRAMGISESFLSGESTYNSMEVSLSVFLENLRTDREYMTSAALSNHILPLIAHVNDMMVGKNRLKTTGRAAPSPINRRLTGNTAFDISDPSKYLIPQVRWVKSLRPEADSEHLQTLDTLVEKGIPISLSMYAAAGGVNIDDLINHSDKEMELLKKIQAYKGRMEEIVGGSAANVGEGDDDDAEYSALQTHSFLLEQELASKPRSILNRDMAEDTHKIEKGKKRHVPSAVAAVERGRQKNLAGKVISNLANNDEAWGRSQQAARKYIKAWQG